jgi:tricorn protease interacting factor F2/3
MMQSWIEQPGFPIIDVERKGNALFLSQKRFTYLPDTFDQHWLIPIHVLIFNSQDESREIKTLFDDIHTQIDLGDDAVAYKVNSGQTGFYRVKYKTPGDLAKVGKKVLSQQLPPEDRWGLQNDLFALVRCGEATIDDYLNFLSYYQNEDAFLPLSSIAGNLFQAYLVLEGANRKKIIATGKSLLEDTLERIGYNPSTNESQTTAILRDQIILQAVIYGSDHTSAFANDKFKHLTRGGDIHPDIQKSILQVGALKGQDSTYRWLIERFQSSVSEHERMNILAAMGCFSREQIIHKALQYVLDKVPDRNKFIPIVATASNPYALDYLWDWYLAHLAELEKFHPMLYERVIAAIVPVCGIKKEKDVKQFFNQYMQINPHTKEVVKLSLERLEINVRMKNA